MRLALHDEQSACRSAATAAPKFVRLVNVAPARVIEAATSVAVADRLGIDVCEVTLTGPALISNLVGRADQIGRSTRPLIAKNGALDADLTICPQPRQTPSEYGAATWGCQNQFLAGTEEKSRTRRDPFCARATAGIVPVIHACGVGITVKNGNPICQREQRTLPNPAHHAAFGVSGVARVKPERRSNSERHNANGTAPLVAASIERAVSASGKRLPPAYRATATWVLPIWSAKPDCVTSSPLRYALREFA